MSERITVEVVFALPSHQELVELDVDAGATVADVIAASGIASRFPDEALDRLPVGIWGRLAEPESVVGAGDRVEIYRPLEMDPKEARRQLALAGRTMADGRDALPS